MRRAFIKQGDQTMAGGWVMEGAEDMEHEGTPLSFIYAKVWCPVCNTEGYILPHADSAREDFQIMTHLPALEFDICACKCDPRPLIIASQHDMTT